MVNMYQQTPFFFVYQMFEKLRDRNAAFVGEDLLKIVLFPLICEYCVFVKRRVYRFTKVTKILATHGNPGKSMKKHGFEQRFV